MIENYDLEIERMAHPENFEPEWMRTGSEEEYEGEAEDLEE